LDPKPFHSTPVDPTQLSEALRAFWDPIIYDLAIASSHLILRYEHPLLGVLFVLRARARHNIAWFEHSSCYKLMDNIAYRVNETRWTGKPYLKVYVSAAGEIMEDDAG
jgi:hypothetical protein